MMEYFRERFIEALNEPGDIEIAGQRWPRHEVLKRMDEDAANEAFLEWVNESKIEARIRAKQFLEEYDCLQRFRTLVTRHQNGNVLPFIGAGMSMASGHLPWGRFLLSIAKSDPKTHAAIEDEIERGRYEEAAQCLLLSMGADVIDEEIHNRLGSHVRVANGPVCLLPEAFEGEVLTTNFDYVLQVIYDRSGKPFRTTISGQDLKTAARRLGNDPHALLRLHGEADTRNGRVLTLDEYVAAYVDSPVVGGLLGAITGTRSMLFMGCSLQTDRTVEALKELARTSQIEPARHYAFLPFPGAEEALGRRKFLQSAGIHPIYYPPADHDQGIEDLLIGIIEGGVE